ncbi:MAG: 2-C-methyl-D-erythritol 4-phosphate cytidylyltransferase [Candidatus Eremiobacteraeota bacterium]|nr:2-C-methyl-D-erythritol 4-phosphate cytidylyltransferase [Candidatus Eremiobacteraeota bacterium]MBV8367038.1 2-C-methyl-D-erythritol 4-phosphate cytidylyltransferase [Candidatus Eremiobacteraeota bacterium]
MNIAAVVAAAGRGNRLGKPKQLLELGGKPMVAWSLELFERTQAINAIYIACETDERARFEALVHEVAPSKGRAVVVGGATRQASVHAALSEIALPCDLVVVHDGARPFLRADVLMRAIAAAHHGVSAVVGVPVKDTIKEVRASSIERTIPRETLWAAQTPQVFPYDVLIAAHARALSDGVQETDDAALVERLGAPVTVVMGSYDNIKITTAEDLEMAQLRARSEARV